MTQRFRLARRVALLLPLLALLALGTIARTPPAAAAGPTIRVTKVDDTTLRVDGSGFTPGGLVVIFSNLQTYAQPRGTLFSDAFPRATPDPFPCAPRRCGLAGGTFVSYIRDIPCGGRITVYASDDWNGPGANEVSAQPCFR